MRLAFLYYDKDNKNFRKYLTRYNTMLKGFFDHEDKSVLSKLNELYQSLTSCCTRYELLSEEESEIYSVVMDFFANDIDKSDAENLQEKIYNGDFNKSISNKISSELPDIDSTALLKMSDKLMNIINNDDNMELLFIPSALNVK